MTIRRVSPQEASELIQTGYTYVDVRSVPEFQGARPAGAVNVPFMHSDPSRGGMTPNREFYDVLKASFPPGSKIILGCQSGVRSMRAAEGLESEGYGDLVELRTGFGGVRDAMGRVVEPGWQDSSLPVESGPAPGKDWEAMQKANTGAQG